MLKDFEVEALDKQLRFLKALRVEPQPWGNWLSYLFVLMMPSAMLWHIAKTSLDVHCRSLPGPSQPPELSEKTSLEITQFEVFCYGNTRWTRQNPKQ